MEKNKKIIALGKGQNGGDAVWGSIGGTISNQTDLMEELNKKADTSSVPTNTSDLNNDSGYITISDVPAQVQSDWNQSDNQAVDYIKNKPSIPAAQVNADWNAVSGVAQILNKPTIPTVNDSTITFEDEGGTTIDSFTLNQGSNKTITIPSGGGNAWYGTQAEFDAIPQNELDPDTDYYISGAISYNDLVDKPFIPTNTNELTNGANFVSSTNLNRELNTFYDYLVERDVWLTQAEYDALELAGKLEEGKNYHIQNDVDVVEMVVTFTDQSTATYNVYVQPVNGGSN